MDSRVAAIRANKLVGTGSCSVVDECMSDEDIVSRLNQMGIQSDREAEQYALRSEVNHLEGMLNCESGEEDMTEIKCALRAVREALRSL